MKKIVMFLSLMVMVVPLFAATRRHVTVDPAGDYPSLSAALIAEADDLVTNDTYLDIEITGVWTSSDTTSVNFDGFTTDATHYVNVYADDANKFTGKWDTTKYRLEVNNPYSEGIMYLNTNYVKVSGLQMRNVSTYEDGGSRGLAAGEVDAGNLIEVSNCLVISNAICVRIWDEVPIIHWKNCVFYNNGETESSVFGYGTQYLYNCVFISSSAYGSVSNTGGGASTWVVKNCYAYNANTEGPAFNDMTTMVTCASNDTSGSEGLQSIDLGDSSGTKFVSLTDGSWDFHLKKDSPLVNVGTDLSGDAVIPFDTDAEGDSRPQSTAWDLGADEYAKPFGHGVIFRGKRAIP